MLPETRSCASPERLRAEIILLHWQVDRMQTSEIARVMGLDEEEVCRVIEQAERRAVR
ncbi:MAG: hypothetical protein RLZZ444_404 [Pseudomonadota bacterium]|jgi:DNA-binding transcriptional regulator LsrR (DeoR family)